MGLTCIEKEENDYCKFSTIQARIQWNVFNVLKNNNNKNKKKQNTANVKSYTHQNIFKEIKTKIHFQTKSNTVDFQ